MKRFSETTAGQIADEISTGLYNKPVDDLDPDTQIILMEQAGQIGREELIDVIISLLPVQFRIHAAEIYDRVSLTH